MTHKVFIGFDTRQPMAFCVANRSLVKKATQPLDVQMLHLPQLIALGLYTRPTLRINGQMTDVISNAPMSTEFAISRFLVPYLCDYSGYAVFCDSDFMFMDDICKVFEEIDPRKAVSVVKHKYDISDGLKMDGQVQTAYPRKNWSSFIVFNCGHHLNKYLTLENVNADKGRELHGFHWLPDDEIGSLNESWNWLEGHSAATITPKAVHYTRGTPDMVGYENSAYAETYHKIAGEMKI